MYDVKLSRRLKLIKSSRADSRVSSLKSNVSGTVSVPIIRAMILLWWWGQRFKVVSWMHDFQPCTAMVWDCLIVGLLWLHHIQTVSTNACSLLQGTKTLYTFLYHACHMCCQPRSPYLDLPNDIWKWVQIVKPPLWAATSFLLLFHPS
jgi:hypothetical protein